MLLSIMRRTYGFKKQADSISLSPIVHGITKRDGEHLDPGAGVGKNGAINAVRRLEGRGVLVVQHTTSAARGHEATTYSIRKAGMPLVAQNNKGDQSLVAQNNKGSHPGGQALVAQNNTQETDVQETVVQEDSNQPPPPKKRTPRRNGADTPASVAADTLPVALHDPAAPAAPYSAYIAGVVQDHSTDLGDVLHWRANVTQAERLWHSSGLGEEAFVTHLHEARRLVRTYQGKQGSGTIANKMGYYFRVLSDLVGVPTELGTGR